MFSRILYAFTLVSFLFVSLLSMTYTAKAEETSNLMYSAWVPPGFTLMKYVDEPDVAEMAKQSGGRLKMKIQYGDVLGSAKDHLRMTQVRIVDLGFCVRAYTPGIFPLTGLLEMGGLARSSVEGTEIALEVFPRFLKQEFKNVKVVALARTAPYLLFLKKKATTLDELRGLKIRATGLMADTIRKLGMEPVNMPGSEIYAALERGIVDGNILQNAGSFSYRYFEQTSHVMEMSLGGTILFTVMNPDSYAKMPDDLREVFDRVWGDLNSHSLRWAKAYNEDEGAAKQKIENHPKHPHTYSPLSPGDLKRVRAAQAEVRAQIVADLESKGLPAKELEKALADAMRKRGL
ncbi:TRAP transporter substrate-binding protein DctP [Thermodesulfobacteriota bacterium]